MAVSATIHAPPSPPVALVKVFVPVAPATAWVCVPINTPTFAAADAVVLVCAITDVNPTGSVMVGGAPLDIRVTPKNSIVSPLLAVVTPVYGNDVVVAARTY
jgi:hypothetical protein